MALQSSGQIKFSQIQAEFGGSHPIKMSEYKRRGSYVYDMLVNTDIPTTNSNIQLSDFYGTRKCYVAGTDITLYSHSAGNSSIGEGFWRVLHSWGVTNCGTFNLSGTYVVGSSYPSKNIFVGIFVNGTEVERLLTIGGGSYHTYNGSFNTNLSSVVQAGDTVTLQGYLWGNYGQDRFESSSLTVKVSN